MREIRQNKPNRRAISRFVAAAVVGLLQSPLLGQINTTWIGLSGGAWTTGGNWSGGVAPNNAGPNRFNVFIDAGAAVNNNVILTGSTTINAVTISAGDQWTINNASTANVVGNDVTGTISNAGTIAIASGGGVTSLNINTASIGLSGGGTVIMSSNRASPATGLSTTSIT